MKVVRIHAVGDLRLHTEPAPVAGPGESLVVVGAVGICGSDLHWYQRAGIGGVSLEKPLVLGHETAGTVADEQGNLTLVAVDPAISCGRCRWCREGNPNLCRAIHFSGHGGTDGALREKMAWPVRYLYPLPETFDAVDGAMLEPLGVAIHAVNLGAIRLGARVGIFGCGPIGLLAVQLARLSGAAQIIATDRYPHRLEAAREFGAHILRAQDGAENDAVWKATEGEGVDVAIEVAGENAAVETALACAAPGATVVLVGIPADERTTFRASTARRKGLTIKMCRRMKHAYPVAIQLVEKGLVDVRSLVSHRFALDEYEEAFAAAERRDGFKVIILPS